MPTTVAAVSQKWETIPITVTALSIYRLIYSARLPVPITGSSGYRGQVPRTDENGRQLKALHEYLLDGDVDAKDIYDAKSSTWWDYRLTQVPASDPGTKFTNVTLARMGVKSIWVTNRSPQDAASLAAGTPNGGGAGGLTDLGAQILDVLTTLTNPTFTCTVSSQTATVGITGADGSATLAVTVDAATGAVVSFTEHLLVTGTSGYEATQTGTTVYAPQTFATPTPAVSITEHKYRVTMTSALRAILAQSIVKAAKPKVKKQSTAAKRVKALRSVVNARIAAFRKAYVAPMLQVTVTKVPNGIRLKLDMRVAGVAAQSARIVVKGSKLVITYL